MQKKEKNAILKIAKVLTRLSVRNPSHVIRNPVNTRMFKLIVSKKHKTGVTPGFIIDIKTVILSLKKGN